MNTLVMRLYFVVHTYMNISVDYRNQVGEESQTVVGCKIKAKNLSTRQSHYMTIDKSVFSMLVNETFIPETFEQKQAIKTFGKREGILISDFDGFMPGGNPIVSLRAANSSNFAV